MRDNRSGPGSGGNTCRSLTDPHQALRKMRMAETQRTRICSIEECGRPYEAKGLCTKHYQRLRKHGDPLVTHPRYGSPEENFSANTELRGECLLWIGRVDTWGYGQIWNGNRMVGTHRYAWETECGQIPDGMELDHRCLNRACCNVAHLRIATRKQNQENITLRADNTSGYRGVYWDKSDKRWRTCVKHYGRKYSAGSFVDVQEAAEAAKALRNELFSFNDLDREGGK